MRSPKHWCGSVAASAGLGRTIWCSPTAVTLCALRLTVFLTTRPPCANVLHRRKHHNAYGAVGLVDPYTGSGTAFDRESGFNEYQIKVKNTGEAASSGPVSVADQLPAGVTFGGTEPEFEGTRHTQQASGEGWHCAVAGGAASATCTRSGLLAPGGEY